MFIFIGDSLIFGYGVHKNEGWVYKISENTSLNIINKGITEIPPLQCLIDFLMM